jgi:hypothetical protein
MQYYLTEIQYQQLRENRQAIITRMLTQSLILPDGYVLTGDSRNMFANSFLAIRPLHTAMGSKMINFIHQVTYKDCSINGEFRITPIEESIRAVGDVCSGKNGNSCTWDKDAEFGIDGRIVSIIYKGYTTSGISAAVQELVSKLKLLPPFVSREEICA